ARPGGILPSHAIPDREEARAKIGYGGAVEEGACEGEELWALYPRFEDHAEDAGNEGIEARLLHGKPPFGPGRGLSLARFQEHGAEEKRDRAVGGERGLEGGQDLRGLRIIGLFILPPRDEIGEEEGPVELRDRIRLEGEVAQALLRGGEGEGI